MLCKSVPTVPHLYVWLLTAPRNDYIDEDLPDDDETDAPVRVASASLIPASSPVANKRLLRVMPFLRLENLWQAGTFAK